MKITKEQFKEAIFGILAAVIFGAILAAGFIYGTSAEVWYAGEHDAKCETLRGQDTCHCYERLVQQDKEQQQKLKK